MLLAIVFLGILLLSFIVIAAATRPTNEDKAVRQRVSAIARSAAEPSDGG